MRLRVRVYDTKLGVMTTQVIALVRPEQDVLKVDLVG